MYAPSLLCGLPCTHRNCPVLAVHSPSCGVGFCVPTHRICAMACCVRTVLVVARRVRTAPVMWLMCTHRPCAVVAVYVPSLPCALLCMHRPCGGLSCTHRPCVVACCARSSLSCGLSCMHRPFGGLSALCGGYLSYLQGIPRFAALYSPIVVLRKHIDIPDADRKYDRQAIRNRIFTNVVFAADCFYQVLISALSRL